MSRLFSALAVSAALLLALPALAATPTVELQTAGRGKKAPLRYTPTVGAQQHLEMRMGMSMHMASGATPIIDMNMPLITMAMDATVERVEAEALHFGLQIASVDVDDSPTEAPIDLKAALDAQFEPLVGATGSTSISPRGFPLGFDLQLAAPNAEVQQSLDQVKQTMNQLGPIFPEEPVGKGAVWTVSTAITQNGMSFDQILTYTLKSRRKNTIELELDIRQHANGQTISSSDMPPGATASLDSFESSGGGVATMSLDQGLAASSTSAFELNMSMTVTVMEQAQKIDMSMAMDLQMSAK